MCVRSWNTCSSRSNRMSAERFFHYVFLAGGLIGSENPALFGNPKPVAEAFCNQYRIRSIVTLTQEHDAYDISGVARRHLPLPERFSREDLNQAFPIIDEALARRTPIWVYCQRGMDRTGCLIGGYLVARGYNAEVVIHELLRIFSRRVASPDLARLWSDKIDLIRSYAQPGIRQSTTLWQE